MDKIERTGKIYLNIKDIECWKCKNNMKACWVEKKLDSKEYGTLMTAREFSVELIKVAESKGVVIEEVYSKTADARYNACICKECGAFLGANFVHNYLDSEDEKIIVSEYNLDEETNITLEYYNENAAKYVNDTVDIEFSDIQKEFIKYIPQGGLILDLGCGSGRDSKAFIDNGYEVISVDGSKELCKIASKYIKKKVINKRFIDYNPRKKFDGIWACASLLHLNDSDLYEVVSNMACKLKDKGYFYMSFKYGDFKGIRNGRYFIDMKEESIKELIKKIPSLKFVNIKTTCDVRFGREDEKWLNVLLNKSLN